MKKYKEYKDETPERTINLIRSILTDLDLLLLDSNANCDNIFACRVILGNHDLAKLGIGMNGKGSTFEYALASGYAEFMEKIQNRFLCDYIHTFYGTKEFVNTLPPDSMYKKKIHKENVALDFRYDEREEYWTLEKVLTSFGSELMLLYHANNIEELKSILIDVIKIEENHILMIPCFSKRDNDEVFVPIDLILHAIGSNGMTAGNSESEALLHGFCEIFERYALKNIYYGELTPPTIPIDEFSDTPVYEKIKYLIEKKGYEIIIKDCSLGKGLPVYGAIIIDKQNHLYNFKLGSDFVPYIAVDRCLNEAYQSTKGFIGLPIDFSWTNNQKNTLNEEVVNSNYHRILESSSGIWPLSIFSPIPSYEYTGENPTWGISNDSDLQYCFNIVEQLGFNIYIRNNSITDFYVGKGIKKFNFSPILHSGKAADKKYDVNINHLIETNLKLMEKINLINNECNNIEDYISEVNISNLLNNLSSLNIYNLCTLAPCGAGHTMLGFDIDGSFYSCDYFIGNLEFKIGNIYEVDDIKNSIFRNPSVQNLLKRNIDSIKECRMCTWKNVCTYHCASDSYFNHKTLYKPHSMCEYVKKIIPRIIDLLYRKKISINNIPPC